MTIYVNKKAKKFLKVVDDPEAAQDYLDDLKQDNFRFFICDDFVSSDIYDGHDQFVSDLLSLPKETQAQLNKALNIGALMKIRTKTTSKTISAILAIGAIWNLYSIS